MKTLSELNALEILLIVFLAFALWSIIKSGVKSFTKRSKRKFRKEYDVTIVGVVSYTREQIHNVKLFGRKYIEIKLIDGTSVEYEGFQFIVKTYRINNESSLV